MRQSVLLAGNCIGAEGAKALCEALKTKSQLRTLTLNSLDESFNE